MIGRQTNSHPAVETVIREMEDARELVQAFSLRYTVFHAMGCIPDEFDSPETELELDNFDKKSIALGCFPADRRQTLIGTVRLITTGYQPRCQELTWRIVEASGDPVLRLVYNTPYTQVLPVFESFPLADMQRRLDDDRQEYCELSRLIVTRPYRRRGLACRLMEAALQHAEDLEVHVVFLSCAMSQVHFYEKLGFVSIDVEPAVYHRIGKLSQAMVRRLASS